MAKRPSTRVSTSPVTPGSSVVAVAAGVVTWAGERAGYGNLVEINHGNGYVTRYAHAERTWSAWARPSPAASRWR